jgi:hypothetical protein
LQTDALFLDQAHTKETRDDIGLDLYESFGRWRLRTDLRLAPTVAYDLTYIDIDTDNAALPERLVDQAVGGGTPVGQYGDWFVAVAGAVGYAGNVPFHDSSAWYGQGTLVVGTELAEESTLVFGLDYDGNRPLYPDIPLPGFAYTKRLDPKLLAVVGFPFSSVLWEPVDKLTVEVIFTFPESFDARVGYNITDHWRIFANYEGRREAFTIDGADDHERMFFEQRRVEAGVRWQTLDYLGVVVAGGYAFNQEFSTGWDLRDTDEVADVSDEAYIRVGFEYRP